jgi:hypothetical protein
MFGQTDALRELTALRRAARVGAPAPKCNVISRCTRLVGITLPTNCDRAMDTRLTLTCETPPPPGRPTHNTGRLLVRTVDGIKSECWTGLVQIAGRCCPPAPAAKGTPRRREGFAVHDLKSAFASCFACHEPVGATQLSSSGPMAAPPSGCAQEVLYAH